MKNTTTLLTIAVLLAACAGQADLPTVTTDEVTAITYNSATVNATVTDDGGAPIEARGVCYSTNPQPSLDNGTCTSNDRGTGSFSAEINNLSTNTTYYRAYATNSGGIGYGNQIQIDLTASGHFAEIGEGVGFDGFSYTSIILGNGQEWMTENLRTTIYANGESIDNIVDDEQWIGLTTGAWCHYDNDSQYENPYGKLYNWYAVSDARNLCPNGWHVPTVEEWTVLISYLDTSFEFTGGFDSRSEIAGQKMKTTGTEFWLEPSQGTNEVGFSALPGGERVFTFDASGYRGGWWSQTPVNGGQARYVSIPSTDNSATIAYWDRISGFSIRCIKD